MASPDLALEPDEIRAIREGLGLSQVEAGELLGGGPRAFTKYEAGVIRPRASVVRLLRVLEANPDALPSLTGRTPRSASLGEALPLEVTGEHISLLTERTFPVLLRKLLSAEALAHNLPEYGIHVAGSITTPDGGEDGRITWTEGPARTPSLPSRFCLFQVKAGKVAPAAAALEVVGRDGEVKPMVRSALEAGGHYLLLCAHPYTQQQIEARKERIREAVRGARMHIDDVQVGFCDADWVAFWVNRHPSVAAWVKQHTQPGTLGPFRSWAHWAGRAEHDSSPWASDNRLAALRDPIREAASGTGQVVRVVGPSGIGKSRLTLEALGPCEEEEGLGVSLADLVLYADESEMGDLAINCVVQTLAENGQRAVMVVDRCPPESHRILVGMTQRRGSAVSLITIDDEIPPDLRDRTIVELSENETLVKVPEASSSVTEAIIHSLCPELPSEDFRRLAHFSRGFPKIAQLVTQAWTSARPVAFATEEHLVEAFVCGRRMPDRNLLGCARLLAAFRLVRMDGPEADQLEEVAVRGQSLSSSDLRAGFNQLTDRGVARRRGGFVTLQPHPIALHLAERQWRDWSPASWDTVLGGNANPDLKVSAAKQLALLNTTDVAREVVAHVCRNGGPFDGIDGLVRSHHTEVLSALVEIDVCLVAERIVRCLRQFRSLAEVRGEVRRCLVWALEKIAFDPDGFEEGADLLLQLAVAENEPHANNATGQFVALFPIVLGNTAADGPARLIFLNGAARSKDSRQRKIVVEALLNGSATDHFSRSVGAETHGSRPALCSWQPTRDEALTYIEGCVDLLVEFATGVDDAADAARAGLGKNLRSLAAGGFLDLVESVVQRVGPAQDSWPEALEALGNFLRYQSSKVGPETIRRVRAMKDQLAPQSLDARVRSLVTEMSWDYLCEEEQDHERLHCRQVGAVRQFAAELVREPETLRHLLPSMSRRLEPREDRHPQRMTCAFGEAIADFADAPLDWLARITEALHELSQKDRDFDLLSGYLVGINNKFPGEVTSFKERAAESDVLAPSLPLICWRLGIEDSDIPLVLAALYADRLPPWSLKQWAFGRALDAVGAPVVAPVFDALLDHSVEGYAVALDLIGMYAFRRLEVLEDLRPQLRKIAENFRRWEPAWHHASAERHFGDLMRWLLGKGRDDREARVAALALARAIGDRQDDSTEDMLRARMIEDRMIKPVIRLLLGNFPEIVWPIVGQTILSDHVRGWRLGELLGSRLVSDERHDAAILNLPEDVLFEWCRAHPDRAPAFTATVVPVLTTYNQSTQEHFLHPCMARLLEEFGDSEDVLRAIKCNINSYFGWGSPTGYYALYQAPLSTLRDQHPSAKVRRWAKATLRELAAMSEGIRTKENEWAVRHDT